MSFCLCLNKISRDTMQLKYLLFIPLFIALVSFNAFSQLSGTKTIGGGTPTQQSKLAIADLNLLGVGAGGVTFNVAAGHTETFSSDVAGTITATGTLSDQIIFQKSGAGANPLITAATGTSLTTDGIIKIAGGDYITFDGIDLQENSGNDNDTKRMEWGYAIVKENLSNGSQNITIKNCVVTLNKANTNSVGIYGGNHTATNTTSLNIASASGTNANIKINKCDVSNCYNPISISGYISSTTYYDTGLEIGTTEANTVSDYGGGSSDTYGIYVNGQNAPKIENNSVASGTGTANVYGINVETKCDGDLILNANTVNDITCGSGILYGVHTANDGSRSISGNQIFNLEGTGTVYGLWWALPISITGEVYKNNIYDLSSSSATGAVRGIYIVTGTVYIYNNFISDLKTPSASASEPITGIYVSGGTSTSLFFNTIYLKAASSGADNFGSSCVYVGLSIIPDRYA
jgi:trimeric autotransporter adhesin